MDNLDDELESSWNVTTPTNDEIKLNDDIKSITNIETNDDIKSITNIEPKKKLTALEVLVNGRNNDNEIENNEEKIANLIEQGKIMLEEFKERGIAVNDIDASMIIKKWYDCKYLNSNLEYFPLHGSQMLS